MFKLIKLLPLFFRNKALLQIMTKQRYLKKIIYFLKKNINFKTELLTTMICIDLLTKKNRFLIIYELLLFRNNLRVSLLFYTNELIRLITLTKMYINAFWCERELWDMFGITFDKNLEIRRLLNDYTFEGFSLRKTYPLSGFSELFYSERYKQIIWKSSVNFLD